MAKLLEVKDLRTYFFTDQGVVRSVDGVSYTIRKGQTVGVVGESGAGRSVASLGSMGPLPAPARVTGTVMVAAERWRLL